jgi:hypothetical protein
MFVRDPHTVVIAVEKRSRKCRNMKAEARMILEQNLKRGKEGFRAKPKFRA